jgi:hypothetical protein
MRIQPISPFFSAFNRRVVIPAMIMALVLVLVSCQLLPTKPEAVLDLYRERMKSGQISEARELLSQDSRSLALELESKYKLQQPPEELALLSSLDPGAAPSSMKVEDNQALMQARTIKGGLRVIRLVRHTTDGPWKVDLKQELEELDSFMRGRAALDMIRGQAGEYAASWKAFSDQLGKMDVKEAQAAQPQQETVAPKPEKPTRVRPRPRPRATARPRRQADR